VRLHRAFVPELKEEIELKGPEAHRLLHVLRLGPGDRVRVFDGQGQEALAEITAVHKNRLRLRLIAPEAKNAEPPVPVVLYVALLKGDKLADVVRAGTELGATAFVPLITARSVPKTLGPQKLERLRRIAREAAKQSGRARVPEVRPPIPLAEVPAVEAGLVAHPRAEKRVGEVLDPTRPLALATGPEGGFTDAEVAALAERGFIPVYLGPRVLRAETAPVALLALVTAGLGR